MWLLVDLHVHYDSRPPIVAKDFTFTVVYEIPYTMVKLQDMDFMEEIVNMYSFEDNKFKKGNYLIAPPRALDEIVNDSFIGIKDVKIIKA